MCVYIGFNHLDSKAQEAALQPGESTVQRGRRPG